MADHWCDVQCGWNELCWPLTSVYLHDRLGVSLTLIGVVLLFNSLASVLGSYLGGYLYDREPLSLIGWGRIVNHPHIDPTGFLPRMADFWDYPIL